jgi:hypothetical protein
MRAGGASPTAAGTPTGTWVDIWLDVLTSRTLTVGTNRSLVRRGLLRGRTLEPGADTLT